MTDLPVRHRRVQTQASANHEASKAADAAFSEPSISTLAPDRPPPSPDDRHPVTGIEANTYSRIVDRVFNEDIFSSYDRLEKGLSLGGGRSDYATLVKFLDEAEDNAREAHRLFVNARLESERIELESTSNVASLWNDARRQLEAEKDAGSRKKQVTDTDVKYAVAELFPEQWRHEESRRIKAKYTKEHLERLADLWKTRAHSLTVMLQTMRRLAVDSPCQACPFRLAYLNLATYGAQGNAT
jgi:hypothetical protein